MKKRLTGLLLALSLLFALSAPTVSARAPLTSVYLGFENTTAQCRFRYIESYAHRYIDATVQLWHDGRCIATWFTDGYGSIDFYREVEVTYGETYTLKVTVYINESALEPVSVTATCQ